MAWTLYKEIKYAADGIPGENLTDFPKLVSITADADIASELGSGGGIKFTSADGSTDLDFGLYPSTNLAAGTILARIKLTLLTAANVGDVMCRLYYSSSESTTEDKAGTVSNSYALFAPLEEDPSGSSPQMRDWVTDTLLGTTNGSMASGQSISASVGNGLSFSSGDNVDFGSAANLDNLRPITIETWLNPNPTSSGTYPFISKGSLASGGWSFHYLTSSGNTVRRIVFVKDNTSGDPSATSVTTGIDGLNQWHCIAVTWTGGNNSGGSDILFRRNGSSLAKSSNGTGGTDLTDASGSVVVGFSAFSLDEVKISSVVRSDNWIDYGYQDENANADTFTLSAEQGDTGESSGPPRGSLALLGVGA